MLQKITYWPLSLIWPVACCDALVSVWFARIDVTLPLLVPVALTLTKLGRVRRQVPLEDVRP